MDVDTNIYERKDDHFAHVDGKIYAYPSVGYTSILGVNNPLTNDEGDSINFLVSLNDVGNGNFVRNEEWLELLR